MQLVETKASKPTYQQLRERLVVEKLNHISSVLTYKWGIDNLVVKDDHESFAIFRICEDCGNLHLLSEYSLDELLSLDADTEADCLMGEFD
ncbi:hypothetical protein [Alicyclobacillus acidiphilus]|uniref:hypothetical protein n=1 Tax=Alicyclobacillus acidiphilus TaxID=182455 RepID=UPI000836E6F8|nr:hypothetical protein [Alicyclobacillus acidiphilus]